ncbi:hypothetical protein [Mycobacterium sp. 1274761.0]|uniref:hypothetical protein n=1 Tax=Mycobacterium sp. 1274761.0 TaxID=1834077 RepID=UPI0008003D1D|nr:hypothetical protein [Mycobacterium sp. 1274761.0]OBK70928.1 hypothetical protein A5651_20235 [Mycobacterium sp. 1274761.0]
MDEIEWSKAKTRPIGGFEHAHPLAIFTGFVVGIACTLLVGIYLWWYALIVPFLIGGGTVLFRRTQGFGLGVVASGCAAVVFVATLAVLFIAF